jgi:hypothetical protein
VTVAHIATDAWKEIIRGDATFIRISSFLHNHYRNITQQQDLKESPNSRRDRPTF